MSPKPSTGVSMLLGMSTTGGAEDRESALEQLEQISSTSQGLDSLQGQERDLLHVLVQVRITLFLRLFVVSRITLLLRLFVISAAKKAQHCTMHYAHTTEHQTPKAKHQTSNTKHQARNIKHQIPNMSTKTIIHEQVMQSNQPQVRLRGFKVLGNLTRDERLAPFALGAGAVATMLQHHDRL